MLNRISYKDIYTAQGTWLKIYNNYKWSIIFNSCEYLCCTCETPVVNQLYLNLKNPLRSGRDHENKLSSSRDDFLHLISLQFLETVKAFCTLKLANIWLFLTQYFCPGPIPWVREGVSSRVSLGHRQKAYFYLRDQPWPQK